MTSTTTPQRPDLDAVLAPALATYSAALEAHRKNYADDFGSSCICGYDPRPTRVPRRSVALHIAAMERRASKAYDAEATAAMDAAQEAYLAAVREAARQSHPQA